MVSENIADSEFTIKWLEEVIQEETKTKASITDFSHTEIGFGRGFLSQILIVKLTWDDDCELLPNSVALKIPSLKQFKLAFEKMPDDDPLKIAFENDGIDSIPIAKAHRCEVAVYDVFREKPPPGLKVPKSYYGLNMKEGNQGVLVMEDLSHGYGTSIADGLTRGKMMRIAETIAGLHAYSLTNDDWRHDDISSTMESFLEAGTFPSPEKAMADGVPRLIDWNKEMFEPLADKCLELCKSREDVSYIYKLNGVMGLPDVFCNGDLHAQNMIWVKDKDGKASDELLALHDWQICHPGNIGEVFARCFAFCVPVDVRRNHYMEVLRHYYECLTKQLGSKPPYTFDQVVEAYKRCFKYASVIMIPLFPGFTKFPELMGENPEETLREAMERCKGMIEDSVAYEAEFHT